MTIDFKILKSTEVQYASFLHLKLVAENSFHTPKTEVSDNWPESEGWAGTNFFGKTFEIKVKTEIWPIKGMCEDFK